MVFSTLTINHGRYDQELSLEHIIRNGGSIYQFLLFLDFDEIILDIEKTYVREPQYHVKGMFMLAIAYHFYGIGYEKTLKKISEFDKDILNFKNNKLPSSSKLCDFVTKQISVDILNKFMFKIALQLYIIQSKRVMIKIANFDSTPIEAARYDRFALYNSHYKCKMYKGHIMMFGVVPLYMKFTDGTTNDQNPFPDFLKEIQLLQMKFHEMNLDAGYDSFENFAKIWTNYFENLENI